ncbi:hypothetical protein G3I40_05380 [Streptomyces sp. SID14478]|uniref:hypothetical protein n=1 Tax=Streptomyces sp. SID14478 TaxID=2706073 RepID=UPI0013DD1C2A|nr:hypothetical protein [Streptomyces sp. SID14478]NEB74664.1 hypothetical protein [Streptomyces sp. SID14478]
MLFTIRSMDCNVLIFDWPLLVRLNPPVWKEFFVLGAVVRLLVRCIRPGTSWGTNALAKRHP